MATGLNALRPIACVAGLNAAVQGLLGVSVGILTLLISFCALGSTPQQQDNDFSQYITYYLQGNECGASADYGLYSGVTGPAALRVWLVLSLFFSIVMLVSSFFLIVAVVKHWSDEKFQVTLVSWLFIALFTAIDDIVLGYIFGSDYVTSLEPSGHKDNAGPLTLGVIAFLAVRGGYVWVLNLVFIIYLFSGARALHTYLNDQIRSKEQNPIENWATVDDFGSTKRLSIVQTPTAIIPYISDRTENFQPIEYPEHSARARWPALNGQTRTQSVLVPRSERPAESGVRQVQTLRETRVQRQNGIDNSAYEVEDRYYLRLHEEIGSSQDYDDPTATSGGRRVQDRGSQWEPSWSQREVGDSASSGQNKWREPQGRNNNGVHIPPVDYLDPPENSRGPSSPGTSARILSLQEAILDRTLRLKKVPEELKRGIEKY